MQTKAGPGAHLLERLVRTVPSLVLLVLLVLAALLLAASSAHATSQPPPSTIPFALEEEGEEEFEEELTEEGELGDELGGDDCELGEEAFEEGLLTLTDVEELCAAEEEWERLPGDGNSHRGRSHQTCLLRSASARVKVTGHNRLKLTIGYTTYEPTGATIEVRGGTTRIGSFRRHLGRSGVLRIVKRLGRRHAPRRLVVRLRIAGSPPGCSGETQRVRIHRAGR